MEEMQFIKKAVGIIQVRQDSGLDQRMPHGYLKVGKRTIPGRGVMRSGQILGVCGRKRQ